MAYDPPSGLSIAMQDPQTCDVLFLANPVSKEAFFFHTRDRSDDCEHDPV